jgi:hypothetical protein
MQLRNIVLVRQRLAATKKQTEEELRAGIPSAAEIRKMVKAHKRKKRKA